MIRYAHTNIIARDWRRLADFYVAVFDCKPAPPERHLTGQWLADGTAVDGAELHGIHLLLPGHGETGPTLEIYTYHHNIPRPAAAANREAFGHIAFQVDDVKQVLDIVLAHGGSKLAKVVQHPVEGVGLLTFTYCLDPEENIIELQSWE